LTTEEVVVAIGTYRTPQLLEPSGTSDPEILNRLKILIAVDPLRRSRGREETLAQGYQVYVSATYIHYEA